MKKILIVGASKGIGSAVLEQLYKDHQLISFSRSIPNRQYTEVDYHFIDIMQEELPELSALDSIVYCPGSINLKPFGNLKVEDFQNDFNINVLGAVKVIQKYMPLLKKSENNASIVLFSTVAANMGMAFHASVAAAKSAVEGLAKSLAAEYAPHIRVNAVAPTVTDTPLASRLLRNDKMKDNLRNRHPLKRYLAAEEVAGLVSFLLSDQAKSISGQVIPLDCGIVSIK